AVFDVDGVTQVVFDEIAHLGDHRSQIGVDGALDPQVDGLACRRPVLLRRNLHIEAGDARYRRADVGEDPGGRVALVPGKQLQVEAADGVGRRRTAEAASAAEGHHGILDAVDGEDLGFDFHQEIAHLD